MPLTGERLRGATGDFLAYSPHDANDQRVAEAEGALGIAHTGICPVVGKPEEPLDFNGMKPPQAPIVRFDDVFGSRSGSTALAGEDGARRGIGEVGEGNSAFGIRVHVPVSPAYALLALGSL